MNTDNQKIKIYHQKQIAISPLNESLIPKKFEFPKISTDHLKIIVGFAIILFKGGFEAGAAFQIQEKHLTVFFAANTSFPSFLLPSPTRIASSGGRFKCERFQFAPVFLSFCSMQFANYLSHRITFYIHMCCLQFVFEMCPRFS